MFDLRLANEGLMAYHFGYTPRDIDAMTVVEFYRYCLHVKEANK